MRAQKNLAEFQNLLQMAVRDKLAPPELAGLILEKPPIDIGTRLKIYQEAYQIRLLESLRDDFSGVEDLIGCESFEDLALEYIRMHPSIFPNLAEYSEGFPLFIKMKRPEVYRAAAIDWLEILSTHEKEPQSLTIEEIEKGTPFKVKLSPSTNSKSFGREFILVFKNQGEVEKEEIDESKFNLIQFFQTERSLDEIESHLEKNQIPADTFLATLQDWVRKQIVYCVRLGSDQNV